MFIRNDVTTLSEDLLFFAIGLTLIGMFLICFIGIFPEISFTAILLYVAFLCLIMALILLPTSVILEVTGIEKVCVRGFNKIKLFISCRLIMEPLTKLRRFYENRR